MKRAGKAQKTSMRVEHVVFSSQERILMLKSAEIGARFYGAITGNRIPKPEITAAQAVIASGQDVPAVALRMVCTGLEVLFWFYEQPPEGIPTLLAKLESICGYQRMGADLQTLFDGKRDGMTLEEVMEIAMKDV